MYNESIKKRFLKSMDDSNEAEYERLFEKVEVMEEDFRKDIFDCTLDELKDVFHHLAPESLNRSVSNKKHIEEYIEWSIHQGFSSSSTNPLYSLGAEWCNLFVTST
jgi:hypothetical protein